MRKVRVKAPAWLNEDQKDSKKMREMIKRIESESIRSIVLGSKSIKSEGKLAKQINFSEV